MVPSHSIMSMYAGMKVATEISLSLKEKQQLRKNINSRITPVRLVERSKIVLLAADGFTNQAIAKEMNIPPNKVGRWRNRFAEGRMKGIIKDKPRGNNQGGKSTEEQARLRQKIITMTTQEKPDNATHWSARTLAEVLNTTHSFVHRVWQSVGLKPHLEKTFKGLLKNNLAFSIISLVKECNSTLGSVHFSLSLYC